MDPFNDREKAFEAKFHVDAEVDFKIKARRDRLLGLWVADRLGLTGDAARDYAQSVVDADIAAPAPGKLGERLLADLGSRGTKIGAAELYAEMDRLTELARSQVTAEVGAGKQSVSP